MAFRYHIKHGPNIKEELKKTGLDYTYYEISDQDGVLVLPIIDSSRFKKLLEIKDFRILEASMPLNELGVINKDINNGVVATEEIGANFLKHNKNISITGKGVLIAIIDSGIDYLHEDFIYPDNTSKIVSIWDQTIDKTPPEGFIIGTEINRNEINEAIKVKDKSLTVDETGHGTMISGICAGLGNINKDYEGVAPDSELIIVKLKKIGKYYDSTFGEAGVRYAYKKAIELNKPLVISLSLGSNSLGGTTKQILKREPRFRDGICIVSGIGNEGNTQTHIRGKVGAVGEESEIELEIFDDEDFLEINIWVKKPDKLTASILSPGGELSKTIKLSTYNEASGLFDVESTWYSITYIYPTEYLGQEQIIILFKNITKGIWKIKLKGEYIINGIYDAYLPNRATINPGTKFRNASSSSTINYPATYDEVIVAGAYNLVENSMWPSSSRGPSINNLLKPDIIAPGVNIISTYPDNKYATITGTSASAAYLSGSIALYLQYTLVEKYYPTKGFTKMIRTYIQSGAKRNSNIKYPNDISGYGKLDIVGAFNQLK